jgi:LPXTG-motif cell wall-anchored protein
MCNTTKTLFVALFSLAAVLVITAVPADAQTWDKKTTITTTAPFEVPGRVLPSGTYVIRIVDALGFRRVVRFFNADESTVLATVIGIADFKIDAPEKTEITFYESPVGTPRPIEAWFYPGSNFGIEFAYPKRRAAAIAAVAEEPVPAIEMPAAAVVEPLPPPRIRELLEEPVTAFEPGGEQVELAEAYPEVPAAQAALIAPELPKTATPLPLLALMGLLAAGAASVLRVRR